MARKTKFVTVCGDQYEVDLFEWLLFHNISINQISMLYVLNLYNVLCQFHLKKTKYDVAYA